MYNNKNCLMTTCKNANPQLTSWLQYFCVGSENTLIRIFLPGAATEAKKLSSGACQQQNYMSHRLRCSSGLLVRRRRCLGELSEQTCFRNLPKYIAAQSNIEKKENLNESNKNCKFNSGKTFRTNW